MKNGADELKKAEGEMEGWREGINFTKAPQKKKRKKVRHKETAKSKMQGHGEREAHELPPPSQHKHKRVAFQKTICDLKWMSVFTQLSPFFTKRPKSNL